MTGALSICSPLLICSIGVPCVVAVDKLYNTLNFFRSGDMYDKGKWWQWVQQRKLNFNMVVSLSNNRKS